MHPWKLASSLILGCCHSSHHRMQLPDYRFPPCDRSTLEHYDLPRFMTNNQHTTSSELSMDVNNRLHPTVDPSYQGVVTHSCVVPPSYATTDGPGMPGVNSNAGLVSAYDGQSCLGLYLGCPDPSFIQGSQMIQQRIVQHPPLIYGRPSSEACDSAGLGLGYQAGSKAMSSQQAQAPQGEPYKTAKKADSLTVEQCMHTLSLKHSRTS